MKTACGFMALVIAGTALSAFAAGPPGRAAASPVHDCCCPTCPGPGLCPCDPASKSDSACFRSSEERVPDVGASSPVPVLRLACDLPRVPPLPEPGARPDAVDGVPRLPIPVHPPEKVPISVA